MKFKVGDKVRVKLKDVYGEEFIGIITMVDPTVTTYLVTVGSRQLIPFYENELEFADNGLKRARDKIKGCQHLA